MFLLILIDCLFYLYPLKGDCTIIMVSFPFSFLIKIFIYQGKKKKKYIEPIQTAPFLGH